MLKFRFRVFSVLVALIGSICWADDSAIHSITVDKDYPMDLCQGDTWDLAWAKDGSLYTPTNDGPGFELGYWKPANVLFNHLTGDDPLKLHGDMVNIMAD